MAFDISILQADLTAIINEFPTTCTINGNDYTCRKANLDLELIFEDDGAVNEYRSSIYINADDLITADIPVSGDLTTLDSVEYRNLSVNLNSTETMYTVHLGEKYAG